ncbi:hypothetical protein KIPB_009780 [Kipferlia bialata]|uniref:Uncharacterized protein n=1 Tax=Kipferlia bialata TaxID=797122 RepID=A0A9K3GMD2_9EUKA|nr:hypothetical protein KIPB_009780 [Kipferlia bialata]|eukprot:g9780.t1
MKRGRPQCIYQFSLSPSTPLFSPSTPFNWQGRGGAVTEMKRGRPQILNGVLLERFREWMGCRLLTGAVHTMDAVEWGRSQNITLSRTVARNLVKRNMEAVKNPTRMPTMPTGIPMAGAVDHMEPPMHPASAAVSIPEDTVSTVPPPPPPSGSRRDLHVLQTLQALDTLRGYVASASFAARGEAEAQRVCEVVDR